MKTGNHGTRALVNKLDRRLDDRLQEIESKHEEMKRREIESAKKGKENLLRIVERARECIGKIPDGHEFSFDGNSIFWEYVDVTGKYGSRVVHIALQNCSLGFPRLVRNSDTEYLLGGPIHDSQKSECIHFYDSDDAKTIKRKRKIASGWFSEVEEMLGAGKWKNTINT
mgnify:CR=1 FL=1